MKKIAVFIFIYYFFCGFLSFAVERRVELVVIESNEQVLNLLLSDEAEEISDEQVRIAGNFSEKGFSIKDIKNLTVEDDEGKRYSLKVGKDGMVQEFGEIVSLWFYFDVPVSYLQRGGVFFLRWGDNIEAENDFCESVGVKKSQKEKVKTFSWRQSGYDTGVASSESANIANIEVIADSRADYFFLWYLLPMAVIFAVLTFRKMQKES